MVAVVVENWSRQQGSILLHSLHVPLAQLPVCPGQELSCQEEDKKEQGTACTAPGWDGWHPGVLWPHFHGESRLKKESWVNCHWQLSDA